MESIIDKLSKLRGYTNESSVCFFSFDKMTTADFESSLKKVCEQQVRKVVFICAENCVTNKKITFYQEIHDIDVFLLKDLEILLRGHRLLPTFSRLDASSRALIIKQYGERNLPQLCTSDPIASLYDFKPGDIIEIKRLRGLYYRYVIED